MRELGLVRIVLFLLSTSYVASCQTGFPHQFIVETPLREQGSLPDAPSPAPQQNSKTEACRSFAWARCAGFGIGIAQENERAFVPTQLGLIVPPAPVSKESAAGSLLVRFLSPPSLNQETTRYVPASNSLIGRALFAVSPVLITHDNSGRARPNTAYFLQVLTSAVFHTAYRPNRTQLTSAAFDGFRSQIGSDAGGEVFHEFEPDIMQVAKHIKIVSRIQQHARGHSQPSVK